MVDLPPWTLGPFELIRHAEEHYRAWGDFDRRVAMVVFDNSIEVAITTYLKLHPSLSGGRKFKSEQIAEWLHNYHTRMEFLTDELAYRGESLSDPWTYVAGIDPDSTSLGLVARRVASAAGMLEDAGAAFVARLVADGTPSVRRLALHDTVMQAQ